MTDNPPKDPRPGRRPARRPTRGTAPNAKAGFLVVGIGASAGGLEACRKLLDAITDTQTMAFVLIQHLDPHHESMMADLLAEHTAMDVRQATEGMPVVPGNLYLIPPGTYLAVRDGTLRVSQPEARHGARLPFDFLLHALAKEYGRRAVGVVLSGTGSDGSMGVRAIKDAGGLVIAQEPGEADYDGMPISAIQTGAVDQVLPLAQIPAALARYDQGLETAADPAPPAAAGATEPDAADGLPAIIELLRKATPHDFRLYKTGTLRRRVERRMGIAGIPNDEMARYLELLQGDPAEVQQLAKDLLINVTRFFRDAPVFETLAAQVIPEMIRDKAAEQSIRIWIAGCSTGEETYSLTMLFREAIVATRKNIKLQVFASDVDPEAVARAREGLYPAAIVNDVSPERLARFFSKEDGAYRVLPELRAAVVFTLQDVLADPPFSRIDLVSCRNLLIYLAPEAQAKVISLFDFALSERGILLLGSSETVGDLDGRFEVVSKTARIYRHIGRVRPGRLGFAMGGGEGARIILRGGPPPEISRQASLAALCHRLVIDAYAPAAVLINRKHECLYSLGPTDRYLRVASGLPSHDLLAMARSGLRTKLRAAIHRASQEKTRVAIPGGRISHDGTTHPFSIHILPVLDNGEELLLVTFIEEPASPAKPRGAVTPRDQPRVVELEQELDAARTELQGAIRNLEISNEEQKAINEEALSVNEEFQSTNEELLTSKEELQSLNEELTALNSQLQETLERQRTMSNDLQNILYSTAVATLFLDRDLNIRFFTPATKTLFSVIASDIGRPLTDLTSLATDIALTEDAHAVLRNHVPVEREIEAQRGVWFTRRILPYRTLDNGVEGVVITFTDITERKHAAKALEAAKLQAEQASIAKSRFLAAASHDLRQPLQTLVLLQGLLAKRVEGEAAQTLVARVDQTLGAMSGMLNTLLDINQIDGGAVRPEMIAFPINDLLEGLREEFIYHALSKGLTLHVVPCGLLVYTDPRLLEQMLRNLLSNALKYTLRGKVLVGCRRHPGRLSIQIWDTGIGIPASELGTIFTEYHQIGNAARERSLGLGLGLAIVKRLGDMLGHPVTVRSVVDRGSVFAVDVPLPPPAAPERPQRRPSPNPPARGSRSGLILVVEDDPDVRDLLDTTLSSEGHRVATAADGAAALDLIGRQAIQPDILLLDYTLPNAMDGLQLALALRERLRRTVPAIVLTGDTSTGLLRQIARADCLHLDKPVRLPELTATLQRLLAAAPLPPDRVGAAPAPPDLDGAAPAPPDLDGPA